MYAVVHVIIYECRRMMFLVLRVYVRTHVCTYVRIYVSRVETTCRHEHVVRMCMCVYS
jgi:hypothetical protein